MNTPHTPDANLAENLRRLLPGREVTRIAKRLHVSRNTIYDWINGVREPRASQIIALCYMFDWDANELLGLKKEERTNT